MILDDVRRVHKPTIHATKIYLKYIYYCKLYKGILKYYKLRFMEPISPKGALGRTPSVPQVTSFGAAVPLVVSASPRGGRGVFAGAAIAEGQEVEVCRWDIDLNSGRISDCT